MKHFKSSRLLAIVIGTLLLCSFAEATFAQEVTLYVSTDGNDQWSGTLKSANAGNTDGPMKTLVAARDAARKLEPEQRRRIILLQGRYFLQEPLELDARDEGLTIEAAAGNRVVLYGGRKVTGWSKDGENFYSIAMPSVKEGKLDFRALVVNNRFRTRARLPQEGAFNHVDSTYEGGSAQPTEEERLLMEYDPKDIPPSLDVNNAEVRLYHLWDESLLGVASNDTESHKLKFSNRPGYASGAFFMKKYIVWNTREGMKEPGQWYLDRTEGKLVYWPQPREDISEIETIIPTLESIIRIQGTEEEPVKNITLRGFGLSVTTTPIAAGGFGAGRFAGAVAIRSAENCQLQDLEIFNVSGYGIKASGSNFSVERCHIHHTGAGGLRFQSGEGAVVADNHIHDVGILYPSGIGIWGGGRGARVSHNEIHDTTYTAIDFGGQDHLIEYNLIYRAMEELHDGGGIYTHGGKGIVIRGNYIRDFKYDFHLDSGAWAYYLDERSENCTIEGNLSVRVPWPTLHHIAKNNTLRNNFFITQLDTVARIELPISSNYVFEKNVIYAVGPIIIANCEALTSFSHNLFFSERGQIDCHKMREYTHASSYPLQESEEIIVADPLFIDYEGGLVRLAPDSPALKLGIVPIDVSTAGRR